MKLKLKIRFIKVCNTMYAQRKTWYGWKDITYAGRCRISITSIDYKYTNSNKDTLIDIILDGEYHTCRKHVTIIEYPGLVIH